MLLGGGQKATGRPTQGAPILVRLVVLVGVLLVALEGGGHMLATGGFDGPTGRFVTPWLAPALHAYLPFRIWVLEHPVVSGGLVAMAFVLLLLGYRAWLIAWHNHIVPRINGIRLVAGDTRFPLRSFDLLKEVRKRPEGTTFVGLSPERGRWWGWNWRPIYVSQRQKTMHTHVLGKTGSGKTVSVLWPAVLQDLLDGKGVVVMDAKGSDENVQTMKALAALSGRSDKLKVFSLPAWNQPEVFSHSYNLLYVRPRTPTDRGGDPVAVAERVFAILDLGDNEYYNTQAQMAFVNVVKLLHGMVDGDGVGLPFVLQDVAVCLKGIGGVGGWERALKHCLEHSLDRRAAEELVSQIGRLGNDLGKCFSGVVGALDKFSSPLVNAYAPDLVFEDVLQENGIVYVQLPANLFKLQAPAMGRVMLMDIQQEGSLRQVFRSTRNQTPCAIVVDEFYNFADLSVVDSLNKLRDANLEFTLAHQSLADLELVSKEFAGAVWDNTRTKHVLNQDNPALCEQLSKSIGTEMVVERTVRSQEGALLTSLMTGDASTKLVDAFRLHPNAIKDLGAYGQGYVINDEGIRPVCYGMVPEVMANYPLPLRDQEQARGLRLFATFVAGAAAA